MAYVIGDDCQDCGCLRQLSVRLSYQRGRWQVRDRCRRMSGLPVPARLSARTELSAQSNLSDS